MMVGRKKITALKHLSSYLQLKLVELIYKNTLNLFNMITRNKVKVFTKLGVQALAQQLTGLEIEVEVEVHSVYTFWYLWHIFSKMFGHLCH